MTNSRAVPTRLLILTALFLISTGPLAHAFSTPFTELRCWEEAVVASEFTGLVECVTAGVSTSTFRVVETWYGNLPEATFRFSYPALCGDRYVMALRSTARPRVARLPYTILQPMEGSSFVGQTWPEYPTALLDSDMIGHSILTVHANRHCGGIETYGRHLDTVDDYRAATSLLSGLSGAQLEAVLVRGVAQFFLGGMFARIPAKAPEITLLEPALADVHSLDNVLEVVLSFGYYGEDEKARDRARLALVRGGAEVTLSKLRAAHAPSDAVDGERWLVATRSELNYKLWELSKKTAPPPQKPRNAPIAGEVDQAKKHLQSGPVLRRDEWEDAFELLTFGDPVYLAQYLQTVDLCDQKSISRHATYSLACWFVNQCPSDHRKCYRILSESDIVPVKAIGTLYLSLLDSRSSLRPLKKLARTESPTGPWAAAYLVAHGKKDYVPRAFELLKITGSPQDELPLYQATQALFATLSNGAAESKVSPMPDLDQWNVGAISWEEAPAAFAAWWDKHHDQIHLRSLEYAAPDCPQGQSSQAE